MVYLWHMASEVEAAWVTKHYVNARVQCTGALPSSPLQWSIRPGKPSRRYGSCFGHRWVSFGPGWISFGRGGIGAGVRGRFVGLHRNILGLHCGLSFICQRTGDS